MPKRPLHCYLPECPKPILLKRRLWGFWYCCHAHYDQDRERREKDSKVAQGIGGPARCARCKGRISWWRYVRGYEFCSGRCYLEHGVQRRTQPVPRPIRPGKGGESITRPIFIAVASGVLLALVKGDFFKAPATAAPAITLPPPKVVSFAREIAAWNPEVLREWIHTSASPAWRLEGGGLQVLDTLLFGSAARASAGTLSFSLSLNDSGTAKFVLGSDALASQCCLVELVSTPLALKLRALLQTADGISEIGGLQTITRANKSKHSVAIAFSNSSLNVNVNGESRNWPGLGVAPGHIGFSGREEDGFRVYRTGLQLTL